MIDVGGGTGALLTAVLKARPHMNGILFDLRAAMHQASRLVLLERVMPERVDDPDRDLANVMSDLHMMILLGGQERTPTEYGRLFSGAGLTMTRQVAMESAFGAFEAVSN